MRVASKQCFFAFFLNKLYIVSIFLLTLLSFSSLFFLFLFPLGETLSDAAAWTTKQFNAEAEALKAVIQGQFLIFFLKKTQAFIIMYDHKYA